MRANRTVGRVNSRLSRFNLSHRVLLDAWFGKLYPVLCKLCIPGDIWKLKNEIVVRFSPLVAPILHEINVFTHTFFVPLRVLWDGFEDFRTMGIDGRQSPSQPKWYSNNPGQSQKGTLYDYCGFDPVRIDPAVNAYVQRAYNMIYNEFYRDQHLEQEEVPLNNNELLDRNYEKDYFTNAAPDIMLGDVPALPVTGTLEVDQSQNYWLPLRNMLRPVPNNGGYQVYAAVGQGNDDFTITSQEMQQNDTLGVRGRDFNGIPASINGFSVDANALREIVQVTKWKERNMRAGNRLVEHIKARYWTNPRDDRLQRPEYVGGTRSPVIISEVRQTSGDAETPEGRVSSQGNLAGHAVVADTTRIGRYVCREDGVMMTLLSVMPRALYVNGNDREWTLESVFDYYSPEFQCLGEQPIFGREVVFNTNSNMDYYNNQVWAYQGRYNEYRYARDKAIGLMRDDFVHWHMGRLFDPVYSPNFNNNFLKIDNTPQGVMRCFAVPTEPPMIIHYATIASVMRQMVSVPNPGLMDHF